MNTTPQNTPFKQTEIGPIPQDWEVKKLVDLCIKIQDGTHFSPKIGGNDYLYVTSKNIKFGFLDISNADSIDTIQHQNIYKRCDVKFGDLLLTKDGANTGNAAINTLSEEFSLLSSVAFLRFDEKSFNVNYFLQQILSFSGQFRIKEAMSGNAITRLTLEKIKKLSFPLPPTKAEQTAIATALSDADALIGGLEKLIHKKRLLKQATMQHLLTPKEDWEVKKLGEVLDKIVGGGTPSRSNTSFWGGSIPWVTVKDFATYNPLFTQEYITKEGLKNSASNLIPKGTLITSTRMALGKAVIYDVDVSINQDLKALFPKKDIDTKFLFYWFFSKSEFIESLGSGSTVMGIALPDLKKIEFLKPPLAEQTRIATILSDMDAELSGLEVKLEKYRQLKQGMMQQLLTGKIRLV